MEGVSTDKCGPRGVKRLLVVVVAVLNGGAQYTMVVTKEHCPEETDVKGSCVKLQVVVVVLERPGLD